MALNQGEIKIVNISARRDVKPVKWCNKYIDASTSKIKYILECVDSLGKKHEVQISKKEYIKLCID